MKKKHVEDLKNDIFRCMNEVVKCSKIGPASMYEYRMGMNAAYTIVYSKLLDILDGTYELHDSR